MVRRTDRKTAEHKMVEVETTRLYADIQRCIESGRAGNKRQMEKKESTEIFTITAHKNAVEELYKTDPQTQKYQLRISTFLLKHPELTGISYASADLLIAEKNPKVQNAAIKCVSTEIDRHRDVNAPGFRFVYRKVTENQVRRILHTERIKENPNVKIQKPQSADIELKCPFCKKNISYQRVTRDNVASFRATEAVDDAITHLANTCGVTRSFLVSELLYISRKYGIAL